MFMNNFCNIFGEILNEFLESEHFYNKPLLSTAMSLFFFVYIRLFLNVIFCGKFKYFVG